MYGDDMSGMNIDLAQLCQPSGLVVGISSRPSRTPKPVNGGMRRRRVARILTPLS